MMFAFAVIGALAVFCAVVCACALLLASLLPEPEIVVAERPREMVPLVPAVTRKNHPDVWVN